MDYNLKYIKYKQKYIQLQNQIKSKKQFGGDWTCSKCTCAENKDNEMNCQACGFQKPRVSGIKGDQNRQITDRTNEQLDRILEKDMGDSTDEITQQGNVRKEFIGK